MRVETTWQNQTAEQALESCIVKIREGVKKESCHPNMQIDPAAEASVRERSLPKFKQNLDTWNSSESVRVKVWNAALAIGKVAHILTDVSGRPIVDQPTMQDAVKAVKQYCTAGLPAKRDPQKWIFCPD
jgi:hypothetical protein